jgi:hypothetical protein
MIWSGYMPAAVSVRRRVLVFVDIIACMRCQHKLNRLNRLHRLLARTALL